MDLHKGDTADILMEQVDRIANETDEGGRKKEASHGNGLRLISRSQIDHSCSNPESYRSSKFDRNFGLVEVQLRLVEVNTYSNDETANAFVAFASNDSRDA